MSVAKFLCRWPFPPWCARCNPPLSSGWDQVLQFFAQQRAFGFVLDALRYADMGFLRQIDQQAAGNADLRGKPRALGADRILDDLHQQLLAVVQDAFDRFGFFGIVLAMHPDVGHVQESGAVQSDLDEGRLHARQYPADFAQIDIADHAATAAALDVQFLDDTLLHHRHPGFLRA